MQQKQYLNSWKEVAQYLRRSERTVQRWERHLGFPVHRPAGRLGSSVMGVKEEIDEWMARSPAQQSIPVTSARELFDAKSQGTVMLFSTDKADSKLRRALLETRGYRVFICKDLRQGIELFEQNPVDLVVLDDGMARLDAEVIARMLRRRKPRVPIIILAEAEQLPSGTRSLIDRVLLKRDGPTALLLAIEAWTHRVRAPSSQSLVSLSARGGHCAVTTIAATNLTR